MATAAELLPALGVQKNLFIDGTPGLMPVGARFGTEQRPRSTLRP
jgi:hypothetical protein